MDSPNYYAVIPANVRYNQNLSSSAKLLYGEITALCNKTGECWATNKYFADLYGVSDRSIRDWISDLQKEGVIEVVITKDGDGTNRIIRLLSSSYRPEENFRPSSEENFLQNNTRGEYYNTENLCNPLNSTSTLDVAVEQFQERWNSQLCEYCPKIGKIVLFNQARRSKIRARLSEVQRYMKEKGIKKDLLDYFLQDVIYDRYIHSQFLRGEVPGRNGSGAFKMDVNHVIRPEFLAKMIEYRYDDRPEYRPA